MGSAQAIVEGEVRELVRRRGIDPISEPDVVARLIDEVVGEYRDRSITSKLPPMGDIAVASHAVLDAVAGFGPLQPLLDDPSVEEIWINDRPGCGCIHANCARNEMGCVRGPRSFRTFATALLLGLVIRSTMRLS